MMFYSCTFFRIFRRIVEGNRATHKNGQKVTHFLQDHILFRGVGTYADGCE